MVEQVERNELHSDQTQATAAPAAAVASDFKEEPPRPAPAGSQEEGVLPEQLLSFLADLSVAVHRFNMYPENHPSLPAATARVRQRLSDLLETRGSLCIVVGRGQLFVEGGVSDPKHPLISDLARRMYNHQVGTLTLRPGVTPGELTELIRELAGEVERGQEPLGLRPGDDSAEWENIHLTTFGYAHLKLEEQTDEKGLLPGKASQLWTALAHAALRDESGSTGPQDLDPQALARAIGAGQGDPGFSGNVLTGLVRLTENLSSVQGVDAEEVKRKLQAVIDGLDEKALEKLLEFGGEFATRKKFVLAANQTLTVDAVMKLLKAAAAASRQNISSSLVRLLAKLSVHADQGAGLLQQHAARAVRENVDELLTDWELEDPNPEAYTQILDRIARAAPVLAPRSRKGHVAGTVRLLQMSLELGSFGPTVKKALSDLMDQGRVGEVLEILDHAPKGCALSARVLGEITTPDWLARLVSGEDVDESGLWELASRIGPSAIDPLLDALAESESRAVRRKVFDCLVNLGPQVGAGAVARLRDPRWFVQRNMLSLIGGVDPMPPGFDAIEFLTSPDERVRREAFPVALRQEGKRARALQLGVSDPDERLARAALLEARHDAPPGLDVAIRCRFLTEGELPDLRPLAIRALARSQSEEVRDLLVTIGTRRTWLGRKAVAAATPDVLAALWTLSRAWARDPQARLVLDMASHSPDPQIRAAAAGRE